MAIDIENEYEVMAAARMIIGYIENLDVKDDVPTVTVKKIQSAANSIARWAKRELDSRSSQMLE